MLQYVHKIGHRHPHAVCAGLVILCYLMHGCAAPTPQTETLPTSGATDVQFPDGFSPEPRTGNSVVSGPNWIRTQFDEDLFGHTHQDTDNCPGLPYREEYGGVEIDTGRCDQITLIQPSLISFSRGDRIRIIAWHSQLISADPEAHTGVIMIAMGNQLFWSEESPIPSGARSFDLTIESQVDIAAGDPIRLHVHNHGANAWNVLSVEKMEAQ